MATKPLVNVTVRKHKSLRAKMLFVGSAYQIASAAPEIADLLVKRVKRRYIQGVDANGTPWEPYSPESTPARHGMLRNTNALFNSIRKANSSDTGSVNTGAGFRIVADAKSPKGFLYGIQHNLGSLDGHIPQRNFMGVSTQDHRAVVRKFHNILDAKAKLL